MSAIKSVGHVKQKFCVFGCVLPFLLRLGSMLDLEFTISYFFRSIPGICDRPEDIHKTWLSLCD